MNWLITDKGDQDVRVLADGHYSRQTPGDRRFTRNGQNLVFVTADLLAGWVTHRPKPGVAKRADGLDAYECSLFVNRGPVLSSELIREATALTWALWGVPTDGLITYVKPSAVKSGLPGYCFIRARWKRVGYAKDGKPMFRAPWPKVIRDWREWEWRGERGGVLRKELMLV